MTSSKMGFFSHIYIYNYYIVENQEPIKLAALNGEWENCYR